VNQRIPIANRNAPSPIRSGSALFALGFRPFFLAAGLSALCLVALWVPVWKGSLDAPAQYGAIGWHGHEMLFGYVTAVVAGFLLTAVRNWTGVDTITGTRLALLAAVWLMGRIAPWLPQLAGWPAALLDMAFLPLLAVSLVRPLFQGKGKLNRVFPLLLLAMAAANALVHAQGLGLIENAASRGSAMMVALLLLLILMVTGRVMPFFTEKAVTGAAPIQRTWVETLTVLLAIALVVVELWQPSSPLSSAVAAALAAVQIVRLLGWHHAGVWRIPILAVLYAAYLWLILALVLKAMAPWPWFAGGPVLGLHALTVGGIGLLTLGMMARVSLGHTGRPMRSSPQINLAFLLLLVSALARVGGPLFYPEGYRMWIHLSAGLWIGAFALFVWVFAPVLVRPRVDGRPG